MSAPASHTDVVIIGGGPVGLYLAGLLLQQNLNVVVLEQKEKIDRHSKSLGIHPVSLELFEEAGIADRFLKKGLKIEQGVAFIDNQKIGELSFLSGPKPFNFILALPQYQTEEILEAWVLSLSPSSLVRGARVTAIQQANEKISVSWEKDGNTFSTDGLFVAGCDGKNSQVRQQAGIQLSGFPYPDTYIMGDFTDNTDFGTKAAIFLHRSGLIESFPLPKSYRRWVVKTDAYIKNPDRETLQQLIDQRIGHTLHQQEHVMISSFGVQHQLAETFHAGRVMVAGDAAHVVSPIGGQGMNLGWINANKLAEALVKTIHQPNKTELLLKEYTDQARKTARIVAKRAEMNMWMGRKQTAPFITALLARLIVRSPFSKIAVRRFTMRGLIY